MLLIVENNGAIANFDETAMVEVPLHGGRQRPGTAGDGKNPFVPERTDGAAGGGGEAGG